MRISTTKPDNESLGMWNCYVAEGKDKNDRNARLSAAPEHLRDDIKIHVETVFELRSK